jgi:DNA-binding LacI/PurR family transcriptional regulator
MMATGVLHEAVRRGLRVPEQLSVIGFDGVASDWTLPPLTTIEQPIGEIAETAVTALRRLIRDPHRPLPNFVFRPKLRLGGTTARCPVGSARPRAMAVDAPQPPAA